MQDNWPSVMFAMAGGIVLSLGNLSTQYAWAFVGLSVTEVITSSITVVIGFYLCSILFLSFICLCMSFSGKETNLSIINMLLKYICLESDGIPSWGIN